jgi:peptidyl-prolyl cis-trans isomerase SurA
VADGLSVAQFRDELRSQMLLARVRDREVEPKVRVSDLEVDQFIQEQQGSNDMSSMELNLAQILVAGA